MRRLFHAVGLIALLAACHSGPKPEETAPAAPDLNPTRPLAQLAAQRVVVTPAYNVRAGDAMGWAASLAPPREYLKKLDIEIQRELGERGLKTQWYYPPDLARAARSNPSYAVDPYSLGVNVLRSPAVVSGTQFQDPLATQLRTMIALQEGARAVLVPVELSFEKSGTNQQVAVLRVVVVDGRLADVRWAGSVRSDPATTFSSAVTTSLAARLADLIAAP